MAGEAAPQAAHGPSADKVRRRGTWLRMRWHDGKTYRLGKDGELGWCVLGRGTPTRLLVIAADLHEVGEQMTALAGAVAGGEPS